MKKMNFTFSPIVFTLFEQIFDVDKSGTIDYQEFFTLILYLRELEETFEKQGEVSDWAKALLGPRATAEDVRELQQKVRSSRRRLLSTTMPYSWCAGVMGSCTEI
jgi:hypothetical protein